MDHPVATPLVLASSLHQKVVISNKSHFLKCAKSVKVSLRAVRKTARRLSQGVLSAQPGVNVLQALQIVTPYV